jgi:class 3 adenylate cyclase/predicted ATPase
VSELEAWLQQLGLARLARLFRENEIDFETLPYLTDDMLAQMGLPIGPRAKLLAAISELAPSTPSDPGYGLRERVKSEPSPARRAAERRQLTVMFCDLVDSTRLAGRLDPEDFQAVMEAYQGACGATIKRYDGHISQYRGDGIEVYFGWPVAQEDAAERAVRAGLEVIEAVTALSRTEPLLVRVGVNTGLAIVGESGFGDPSIPSGAVGETLHVAARIQSLATPNSVVIGETTSRLVLRHFVLEDLGAQNLKGLAEPIRVFRVLRPRQEPTRFQAAHANMLTPLIGRHAELAFLQQCWRDAKEGDGQTVFISGIPGIGKSRIVHELKARIETESHFCLTIQCSPHCMQTALFPVIQLIQRLSGLTNEEPDEAKLDKIKRLLSLATSRTDNALPFVAEMMSIPIASRYQRPALSAKQMKVQILSVLVELLRSLSAKRPIYCLLEDIQWIDPSTQELLDLLVSQIDKSRILLVATHRPEYQPQPYGNVRGLTVNRLKRRDAVEMTRLALGDRTISTGAIDKIIDESDSIPLFVEELALGVVDSESASSRRRTDSGASWSVPESLRDSLAARLDRAPAARNVAQAAAVIGREFSHDMLLRITSVDEAELDSAIEHLKQNEIIRVIESRPLTRYSFKHSLVRDVAYESLLKSSRREIHAKIAAVVEKENPEIVSGRPELLAYHYSLAGDAEMAVRYWMLGGHRARARSANLEASAQYQKAVELLASLPETPERRATELDIQLSLGGCFIALHGYSSEDTRRAFESACGLSDELGDRRKELQAIFGLWGHFWMRAQHDRAIELGEMLLAKADQLRDLMALIVGWRCLGSTLFTLGDFVRARDHLDRAVALGQQSITEESSLTYAVDPRIAAQLLLAWDLWILGYPEQALRNVLQAHSQARQRDEAYTAAFACYVTSAVQLLRGETQASLESAEQSLALSREHHINLYALYSRFGRGCALAKLGQLEPATVEIRAGIEEARRINLGYMRGFMLGWLATIEAESGQPETALSTLDEALQQTNDVTGRAWEAELFRLRGDVLLAAGPDAVGAAEQDYVSAITVARKQSARSLELRATASLARLLRAQGRNDEARGQLAPVFDWFTEGFDTADLKQAKALLDELARPLL